MGDIIHQGGQYSLVNNVRGDNFWGGQYSLLHRVLAISRISLYNVAMYFTSFEGLISCIETLVGYVMCLKGLIAVAFESSKLLHLLRLNGRVGAIPT